MVRDPDKMTNVDPERGDAILKRMLKTKPKPHKDMKKGKAKEPARNDKRT